MMEGSLLFMIFFGLSQPGQMPFHLQFNAHGNVNAAGQNKNS
jgi:hypothetical protein